MNMLSNLYHYIVHSLTIIDHIMMIACTLMWFCIQKIVNKQLLKNCARLYSIECQMNFMVNYISSSEKLNFDDITNFYKGLQESIK